MASTREVINDFDGTYNLELEVSSWDNQLQMKDCPSKSSIYIVQMVNWDKFLFE